MKAYPVKFAAVIQERIWGGNKLKDCFHVKNPQPIGEYWVLSGHPNGPSVVTNGELAGKTINELTKEFPEAYLGRSPQERFPLLIKFLEAAADLSVQIHPTDSYANEVEGDYGKTEAWYILEREPNTEIIYGHHFENREQYLHSVHTGTVRDYLKRERIEQDQLIYVPAQTLHAILAGTILIEIQQTSDVTYRVYDWDRTDAAGKTRELHIDKAADVMKYGDAGSANGADLQRRWLRQDDQIQHEHLVTCPYFTIEKMSIHEDEYALQLGRQGNPDVLVIASGEGILECEELEQPLVLRKGDAVLIPGTGCHYSIRSSFGIRLLRTYY